LTLSGFDYVLIKFPSAVVAIGGYAAGFHACNTVREPICRGCSRGVLACTALAGNSKVDHLSHAALKLSWGHVPIAKITSARAP